MSRPLPRLGRLWLAAFALALARGVQQAHGR